MRNNDGALEHFRPAKVLNFCRQQVEVSQKGRRVAKGPFAFKYLLKHDSVVRGDVSAAREVSREKNKRHLMEMDDDPDPVEAFEACAWRSVLRGHEAGTQVGSNTYHSSATVTS